MNDVDERYETFRGRGLVTTQRPESPVHTAPVNQTWGLREFSVTGPDGNGLCFCAPIKEIDKSGETRFCLAEGWKRDGKSVVRDVEALQRLGLWCLRRVADPEDGVVQVVEVLTGRLGLRLTIESACGTERRCLRRRKGASGVAGFLTRQENR